MALFVAFFNTPPGDFILPLSQSDIEEAFACLDSVLVPVSLDDLLNLFDRVSAGREYEEDGNRGVGVINAGGEHVHEGKFRIHVHELISLRHRLSNESGQSHCDTVWPQTPYDQ